MNKLITVGIFLAAAIAISVACSCFPQHPQQEFCGADFVIHAKILSRGIEGGEKEAPKEDKEIQEEFEPFLPFEFGNFEYKIKLIRVYKNKRTGRRYAPLDRLYSAVSSSMCGLKLPVGGDYLIMGRISVFDGKARTDACSLTRKWSSLKKEDRKRLWQYRTACKLNECQVQSNCFGAWCKPKPGTCQYNPMRQEQDYCLTNQLCVKNEEGECQFEDESCARPPMLEKEEFVMPSATLVQVEEPHAVAQEVKESIPVEEEEEEPVAVEEEHAAKEEEPIAEEEETVAEEEEPIAEEEEHVAEEEDPIAEEEKPIVKPSATLVQVEEPVAEKEEVKEPVAVNEEPVAEKQEVKKPVAAEEEAKKPVAEKQEVKKPVAVEEEHVANKKVVKEPVPKKN